MIPGNTEVDMANVKAAIMARAAELHPDDIAEGIDRLSPLEKKLLNYAEERPTYKLLDQERKAIGEASRKATGPYQSEQEGNLKYLYSMLTSDQEKAAAAISQEAADEWKLARGLVEKRKNLEDESLVLLGKNKTAAIMPKFGRAVSKLKGGDFKDFDEIIQRLPEDLRQKAVVSALNDAFVSSGKREQKIIIQ